MLQVNYAPLTAFLCLELQTHPHLFYIAFRGNNPSSGLHLGVWATQLPGQLGSHAGQCDGLSDPVWAAARELSEAAGGGW